MNDHDQNTPRTEADRTSQTRFGPRPVPKDHLVGGHRAQTGRHPQPSLSTKLIVWGGVALAVAGGTAGALMATRKIANLIADEPAPHPSRLTVAPAPRPRSEPHPTPAPAPRARPASEPPRNIARELTQTAQHLSGSLNGVAGSLLQAFEGFRRVAAEANGIVSEFARTADQVRTVMRGLDRTPTQPPQARPARETRTHRL